MEAIKGAWSILTRKVGAVRVDFSQPFSLQVSLSTCREQGMTPSLPLSHRSICPQQWWLMVHSWSSPDHRDITPSLISPVTLTAHLSLHSPITLCMVSCVGGVGGDDCTSQISPSAPVSHPLGWWPFYCSTNTERYIGSLLASHEHTLLPSPAVWSHCR